MTNEQRLLVETELLSAVSAFHDLDDVKKRNAYVKDYTIKFCNEHNIDISEAIDCMKKYFDEKRKTSQFKYEGYEDLGKIINGRDDR